MSGRDQSGGRLVCPICDRTIAGLTGYDELLNLVAHMGEWHEQSLSVYEAAELRVEWERA